MKMNRYTQDFINELLHKHNMTNDSTLKNLVSFSTYQSILEPVLQLLEMYPTADYDSLKSLLIKESGIKKKIIDIIQKEKMAPGIVLGINSDNFRGIYYYGKMQEFAYLDNKKVFYPLDMHDDTIFDLASTSKLFTTIAILKLVEENIIAIDDDITKYIPEVINLKDVTIYDLLKFRKPISTKIRIDHASTKEEAESILFSASLDDDENKLFNPYTDIGAMLLRFVVERTTNMPFDEFINQVFLQPLNMQDTYLNVPLNKINRVASNNFATTIDKDGNPSTLTSIVPSIPHDGKARAIGHQFGIAPGHAGYFSTVYDMLTLSRALINHTILKEESIASISENAVGKRIDKGYSWYYGSLVYTKQPTEGKLGVNNKLSGQAFMSPGYAGTSLVVDPINNISCFIGANRLHDRICNIHKDQRQNIITNPDTHRQTFILPDGSIQTVSASFAREKDLIIDEAINLAIQIKFLDYYLNEKEKMTLTRQES